MVRPVQSGIVGADDCALAEASAPSPKRAAPKSDALRPIPRSMRLATTPLRPPGGGIPSRPGDGRSVAAVR